MLAQTLRTVRNCRSSLLNIEPPSPVKHSADIRQYVANLRVIDNPRILTQLSHKLESRR